MGFMHDQLSDGRSTRLLNVINDFKLHSAGQAPQNACVKRLNRTVRYE